MKITTLNSKNPNYTEEHEIFVGTHTGSFKKLHVTNDNPYLQENLQNITNLTKDCRVTAIAYGDDNNSEILIGRSNKFVQVYSANTNEFCSNIELNDGPIVGIGRYDGKIVGGLASGKIQMLKDPESMILATGDDMSRMRQCYVDRRLVASGGKQRQNNMKIFNLETGLEIFKTKNLPDDYLQLEVPIWDSDLGFIDANVISTCSRYGYVRLYDIRVQRRPIQKYSTEDQMSFCSLMARENYIYTGTTMGIVKAFDIRKFKNFLHTYKGFTGSVSDLHLDDTGKYLASASLDRYVRVHHTDSCVMMYQCYVKSKATRILLRNINANNKLNDNNDDDVADDSCIFMGEEKYSDDDEYNEIFEKMPIICENDEPNEVEEKVSAKRKSSSANKNNKKEKKIKNK